MRGDEKDQGVWRHPFSPCHLFQVVSGLLLRLASVFGSYGIPLFIQLTKTEKVMCSSVDRVVEGTGHSLLSGGILSTGSFLISHTLFSSFLGSLPCSDIKGGLSKANFTRKKCENEKVSSEDHWQPQVRSRSCSAHLIYGPSWSYSAYLAEPGSRSLRGRERFRLQRERQTFSLECGW